MNRRDFIKRIIAVPLAVKAASSVEVLEQLDVSRINPTDYFYGGAAGGGKTIFLSTPFGRNEWIKKYFLENITQKLQDE